MIDKIIDIMSDSCAMLTPFAATLPVVVSIGAKIRYIRHSCIQIQNISPRDGISSLYHRLKI